MKTSPKTLNGLLSAIKAALLNTSFHDAHEGMAIIDKIFADNKCKTITGSRDFCKKYGIRYGWHDTEWLIDREHPFYVKGYQLLIKAFSLCHTERYFLAILKNEINREDKARTCTNI